MFTITRMNFSLEVRGVALASYPLSSPQEEHPIMKRHLLTLALSVLAANAFALPATEQHLTAE